MEQKQSADRIVQRLEGLKMKLGDKRAELAGEIDQIAQDVRALGQQATQLPADQPTHR